MIAHASVAVNEYAKSKELYTKMLAPLGYALTMDLPEFNAGGFTEGGKMDFWIGQSEHAGGVHIAFNANSKAMVDAFHAAALAAGAADNGAPGYRANYSPGYYAAFVHDLGGNNIEVVWMDPAGNPAIV